MKIHIFIERTSENKIVNAKNIPGLLKQLKVAPNTVLLVRDDKLITEDAKLKDGDKIKVLSVISGG